MRRLRTLGLNLLLAALSVGLSFGILEILARGWRIRQREALGAQYTEFDPLLGWRHRPGARADFPLGAYAINRRGLRDVEREYEPREAVRRVLVLGDSFAEGYNVPFEDCVSQVLERRLTRPGRPVEVINGGTVAYSTDQEYLFYREELFRYRARAVVLFVYYNDILYNGRGSVGTRPKPLFTFAGGQPRVKNAPLAPEAPPAGRDEEGAGGSAAVEWLKLRLMNASPPVHNTLARLGLWESLEAGEAPLELHVYSRKPPQAVNDAWEFTRHILRALNEAVTGNAARLLVVYVPSKMEISGRAWALTRARFGVDDTAWDRSRLSGLLSRAGGDLGFPTLDLTEPLTHVERGFWGGPYHDPGGHWNALGHKVAAEEVARFLEAEAW